MPPPTATSIQKAIDFIEERLADEDLSLERVARAAGYSSWHFQRLFGAILGQSLKDYIRARRLTGAYEALRAGSAPRLVELAFDCGFETQESFSRAFKRLFGMTPGACRKGDAAQPCQPAALKPRITPEYLDHLFGGLTMTPEMIQLREMHVAGLAANFVSAMAPDTNNMRIIPKLWEDFLAKAGPLRQLTYGVIYAAGPGATRHDELRYMAGHEVPSPTAAPAGFEVKTVPGGLYARFVHHGKIDNLPMTMRYIMGSWLPKSGHALRDAPELEIYGDEFAPMSDQSELPILIPVD